MESLKTEIVVSEQIKMESSNASVGNTMVQFPPDETVICEINKGLPEEIHDLYRLGEKIETLKEEIVGFYGSENHFNTPLFDIQENGCEFEKCWIKLEQSDNGEDEFTAPQNESGCTNEYTGPSLHFKEGDFYIKCDDLETELTESEVYLQECYEWSHEAKETGNLKARMSVHKTKSEGNLYKCHECSHAAKRAWDLKKHMLVHKSEVGVYKCQECSYAAKRPGDLKIHMLVHKAKSEVDLYQCHICSYAAKRACHLKRHMLVHKSKSEVDLYQCHMCSYAAKRGWHLTRHMLVHNSKSEIDLYRCDECSFASKRADGLKQHMSMHKTKL